LVTAYAVCQMPDNGAPQKAVRAGQADGPNLSFRNESLTSFLSQPFFA
jgi:hypothetical protein